MSEILLCGMDMVIGLSVIVFVGNAKLTWLNTQKVLKAATQLLPFS
jgi:hypothetical protein